MSVRGPFWTFVPVVVLGAAACSSAGPSTQSAKLVASPEVAVAAAPDTEAPATEPAPTPEAPPETEPPPPPGLGSGDEGPGVLALEQRLEALKYVVGDVDGVYDSDTGHGVMAFQKVMGLERSGRATDDVVAALPTATPPPAIVPEGGGTRVEIDLERQVLFLYEAGSLSNVLSVSTGTGSRFCSQGWCRQAVTPQGAFAIYEQRSGWETSPLGRLYNSNYFVGGIAIHGSPSVPGEPASHGCVRIPMSAAEWFPSKVSVGTPVYVAGDEGVPAPYVPPPPVDPVPPDPAVPSPGPTSSAPAFTYTPPPPTAAPPPTTAPPSLLGLPRAAPKAGD